MNFITAIKNGAKVKDYPMTWNSEIGQPEVNSFKLYNLILVEKDETTIGAIYRESEADNYTACLLDYPTEEFDKELGTKEVKEAFALYYIEAIAGDLSRKAKVLKELTRMYHE